DRPPRARRTRRARTRSTSVTRSGSHDRRGPRPPRRSSAQRGSEGSVGVRGAARAWRWRTSIAPAMRRRAAAGILPAAVVLTTSAHAQLPGPGVLTETGCDDPTKPNADYEAYGPTDVNVQAGNGRVTVGE